jgi:recombination DNA repair RAD52 pathway protein
MALEKLSIPKEIKDKITAPLRQELIKQRDGGGNKKLSYISGSTVTDMLNNAFGYMWSWRVDKQWIEESQPFFNKYSKNPEKISYNGQQGAWDAQGPVAHVLGTLTVYFKNGPQMVTIEKAGFGSKSILGKQNDQESIFKSAGTDALKKAASLFGIGLELYRDEDEQNFFYEMNYEDPWTDEMLEKYKDEREYFKSYIEKYKVSDEALAEYVYQITGDSYDVTPDNIELIVNNIKEGLAEAAQ